MKKLSTTVRTLLAAAVAVGAVACSGNADKAAPAAAKNTGDSAACASINIRYIDADSVMRSYKLAQQLLEEQQREMNKLQQWHDTKQRELQGLAAKIQQKQQNNAYLSQESMQSDMQGLQNKGSEAERYLGTQQQRLANADLQIRARLADSINNFIKQYNAVHGYDAILYKDAGIYFNPALDITNEVIEGLNNRLEKK